MIGVTPEAQGRGFGGKMLFEFERQARADGVDRVKLSVKSSNEQALRSYTRNGWEEASRDGESVLMGKDFAN
ncbi:GNAT family N-acetyltransferase [Verrucomicrobia bacterium]|nr:GNAT family N-acetyltransferase [Verrucomicrobiota bacterium]